MLLVGAASPLFSCCGGFAAFLLLVGAASPLLLVEAALPLCCRCIRARQTTHTDTYNFTYEHVVLRAYRNNKHTSQRHLHPLNWCGTTNTLSAIKHCSSYMLAKILYEMKIINNGRSYSSHFVFQEKTGLYLANSWTASAERLIGRFIQLHSEVIINLLKITEQKKIKWFLTPSPNISIIHRWFCYACSHPENSHIKYL